MDRSRLELKVGLFVFVALVILAVFIFKIGNLKNYGRGYSLNVVFSNISGVKPGSPVRFAGVDVGEVNRVNVIEGEQVEGTKIEVVAWIRKSVSIPAGSRAYINTLGLLGEKYIEIIPPAEYTSYLQSGDTIVGTDPVMLQYWIGEGKKIVDDLQEIISKLKAGEGTVGRLLNDEKLYEELEGLISDFRKAKEGTLGKLLYDDGLYQELEALISDVRRHPWKLFWKTREKK
ncbi:MAG: MlaD family protein [Candidatus Omnitrophota bacterium]